MTSKANEIELLDILRNIVYEEKTEHFIPLKDLKILSEAITDKFRIIPRTDSPEKHVKIINMNLKLKWRAK